MYFTGINPFYKDVQMNHNLLAPCKTKLQFGYITQVLQQASTKSCRKARSPKLRTWLLNLKGDRVQKNSY